MLVGSQSESPTNVPTFNAQPLTAIRVGYMQRKSVMSSHAPHKRHIQRNKSLEVAMYLLLVVHSYPPKNWFDLRKNQQRRVFANSVTCLRTCGIHTWNCFEPYNPLLFRLIVTCQHDENCHFYSNLDCSSEIRFKQRGLNLLDDVSQLLPHVQRKLLNMKHTRKWRTCIRDIRHIQRVTNSDILCRTFSSTGRYVIGYVIIKVISSLPRINRACTCKTL